MKIKTTIYKMTCLVVILLTILFSCKSGTPEANNLTKDSITVSKNTTNLFEHMLVDNRKDPSCGMPVTAGISDTAHYKNKVLGFCSKECKEDFLKNPEVFIAAAEMKK